MAKSEKKLATLYLDVIARTEKLENELEKIKKRSDKKAKRMGLSFGNIFNSSLLKAIGAAYIFKKALDFAVQSKNAARDAQEIGSKFNTVFESISSKANNVADTISKDFDLATSTTQEMLSATGDLLVGFGFAEDAALDLSDKVARLGIDLASFSNYQGGAKGATEALTKALLGETESAKSLGIVIRQNTKEFTNEVEATAKAKNISLQQAKAIVILDQAYKQSSKAVGDYARTKDSLANTERRLQERIKTLRIEVGNKLMPAFLAATEAATDFVTELNKSGGLEKIGEGLTKAFINSLSILEVLYARFIELGAQMKFTTESWKAFWDPRSDTFLRDVPSRMKAMAESQKTVLDAADKTDKIYAQIEQRLIKMYGTLGKSYTPGSTKAAGQTASEESPLNNDAQLRAMEEAEAEHQKTLIDIEDEGYAERAKNNQAFIDIKREQEAEDKENSIAIINKYWSDQETAAQGTYDNILNYADSFFDGILRIQVDSENRIVQSFVNLANEFSAQVEKMIAKWVAFKLLTSFAPELGSLIEAPKLFGASNGGSFLANPKGLKSLPAFQAGGTAIVPQGFQSDSALLRVSSGERVDVTSAGSTRSQDKLLSGIYEQIKVGNANQLMMQRRLNKVEVDVSGKLAGSDIHLSNDRESRIRSSRVI